MTGLISLLLVLLAVPAWGQTSTGSTSASQVAPGTTAPTKADIVGGKTADAVPQYLPLPLTAGGSTVPVTAQSAYAAAPGIIITHEAGPPPIPPPNANPLQMRAAMRIYCYTNLCPPPTGGLR